MTRTTIATFPGGHVSLDESEALLSLWRVTRGADGEDDEQALLAYTTKPGAKRLHVLAGPSPGVERLGSLAACRAAMLARLDSLAGVATTAVRA